MRMNPIVCSDDGYRFWLELCPHLVGKDSATLKSGAYCPCCENSVAAPSHLCDRCQQESFKEVVG